MNSPSKLRVAIAALAALAAGNARALDPMPVDLGPIEFIPTIGLALGYDDNVEEAPAGAEISSTVTRLTPNLLFRAQERANRYEFSYRGYYEFMADDAASDNLLKHSVLATSHQESGARHRLDLKTSFDRLEERQNATNRFFDESGNTSNTFQVGGVYGFGARTAQGQLELRASYTWLRYLNNLDTGSFNRASEYDSPAVSGAFYYRIRPQTRLLAEIRYADFSYLWSDSTLNSHNLTYLAGATWQATAMTRGALKVGYQQKRFSDDELDNSGNLAWDAALTWAPVERTEIIFSARNYIDEGSSTENYIDSQDYGLTWNHRWLERFGSSVFVRYLDQDYQGGTYDGRNDKTTTLGLKASYNLRRWVDIDLEVNHKENDSNFPQASYDRNWLFVNVNFSL